MIRCPHCGSHNRWTQTYRCPLDPANDKFRCDDCDQKFSRYQEPVPQPKPEQHSVWIRWYGTVPPHDAGLYLGVDRYDFGTAAELNAFLRGIYEAKGSDNWEQFDEEPTNDQA